MKQVSGVRCQVSGTRASQAFALALWIPLTQVFSQEKPDKPEKRSVQERVTVERVVITGRVLDRFANPIPGLVIGDFRLRVDGKETPIESVDWIPGRPPVQAKLAASETLPPEDAPAGEASFTPSARLSVMLFQWEIAGQKDVGFIRMQRQAKRFLESVGPGDEVAVLAFGSCLRLLQDFTSDRAAVEDAIERVRSGTWSGRQSERPGPTLSGAIDACGRTDSIEKGLLCIGNALAEFPGPKTMLFFGWTAATTKETWRSEYPSILEAIGRAETSVFVLDVSDGRRYARQRVLPQSLKTLASDTGGLYNETSDFPDLARQRVERSLEGYYEIVFRDPATTRGWHQVEVALTSRPGTAVFHRWYQN